MGLGQIVISAGLGLVSWALYQGYCVASKTEIPKSGDPKKNSKARSTVYSALTAYHLELDINGHKVPMKIDSGCHNSIISKAVWRQLGEPPLKPSPVKRFASTGAEVNLKGLFTATVQYGGKLRRLNLQVSDQLDTSSLIGRNWFPSLNLDWNSILHCANPSNSLVCRFQHDSEEQLELISKMDIMPRTKHFKISLKLEGVKAHMALDTGAARTRIDQNHWVSLGKPKLRPANCTIRDTAKKELILLGECFVILEYQGQKAVVPILVSSGTIGHPIIGTDMFKYIRFDFNAIFGNITFRV